MGVREEHRVFWPLMGMQKGQKQDVEMQGVQKVQEARRRGGPGHPSNQGQLTPQAPTASSPTCSVRAGQHCAGTQKAQVKSRDTRRGTRPGPVSLPGKGSRKEGLNTSPPGAWHLEIQGIRAENLPMQGSLRA